MLVGRVEDLSRVDIACPAACMGEPLRFRQVGFAAKQGLFGALTVEYFLCQFTIDGRQLAGPFEDTLFKFLIQALDFSLCLLVPGGFYDIPAPAPPCYRKLMCSHHIQDFSCTACGERVSAQHRQTLIGDSVVERLFVFTEVLPILLFEPGGISGNPYARVTSGRCAREFLVPTANHSVEIKRAFVEIPVACRDNLYALVSDVSIEVGNRSF